MSQSNNRENLAKKDQGYVPVNIRMIQNVMKNGKPYVLNGEVIENITLVARVVEFNDEMGSVNIMLADETGKMQARVFKKSGSSVIKPLLGYVPKLHEYAMVIGSIMNFNDADLIVIARMQNIAEYSFVLMHRIQIVWALMIRKKLLHTISNENMLNNLSNRFTDTAEDEMAGLGPDERAVMSFINTHGKENGVTKDFLFSKSGFSGELLKEVLMKLVKFGYLFLNEDHTRYRVT